MSPILKAWFSVAVLITLFCFGLWLFTDHHYYTKFQVVEQVEVTEDEDDIFANTGFYDDEETPTKTIIRDEFHFGLFPTPQGLFDKHILSVFTFAVPAWGLFAALWLLMRLRRKSPIPTDS